MQITKCSRGSSRPDFDFKNVAKATAPILVAVLASTSQAQPSCDLTSATNPQGFIENKGQWDPQAKYMAESNGVTTWITDSGAVYDFHKFVSDTGSETPTKRNPIPKQPKGKTYGNVVRVDFLGSRPASASGTGQLDGTYNYFLGNESNRWTSGVRRFSETKVEQIYDGISARYYFDGGRPRYDLIVKPGANPDQIRMQITGTRGLHILASGDLEMETPYGSITERGLSVYQGSGATKKVIASKMRIDGNILSFKLDSFDRSKPLVIDPLLYSTFLNGVTQAMQVSACPDGGAVFVGYAASPSFPVTAGAYQRQNRGTENAFASKLSPDGSKLIWSTFLGGGIEDQGQAAAIDPSGNVVIVGTTNSSGLPGDGPGFPVTSGAFQKVYGGTEPSGVFGDAFISMISADGSRLIWSSLLGGSGADVATTVAIDHSRNILVGGFSESSNFPTTKGTFAPNSSAGFVAKINPTGTRLIWSTFLDLSGNTYPAAMALDSAGNPIIAESSLGGLPVTSNAFNKTYGGQWDGAISKFSADGSTLLWATYLGGDDYDEIDAMVLDSKGNIIVGGTTLSSDFPTTSGAFQDGFGLKQRSSLSDAFVSKLSADGSRLLWSTFAGGGEEDSAASICLDSSDNVLLVGATSSDGSAGHGSPWPTTTGAFQNHFVPPGTSDANGYVSKVSSDGSQLIWSTFLGGSGLNWPRSVTITNAGAPIVIGYTSADGSMGQAFPTTPGAFETTFLSGTTFVTELSADGSVGIQRLEAGPSQIFGGEDGFLAVHLSSGAAPNGLTVTLRSNSQTLAPIPPTLFLPAGRQGEQLTVPTSGVDATTIVTFSAKLPTGATYTATQTLIPARLTLLAIQTQVTSGASASGSVGLTGKAGPHGTVISLTSNNPSVTVPATVTVPAGASGADFSFGVAANSRGQKATITATCNGFSKAQEVTVGVVPKLVSATEMLRKWRHFPDQNLPSLMTTSGDPAFSAGSPK